MLEPMVSLRFVKVDRSTEVQLFAALTGGPDSGGTWSPAATGAGIYTYIVSAVSPCTGTDISTVTVTEQALPNAGTDGALTICAGGTVTTAQLLEALTGEDAGGRLCRASGRSRHIYLCSKLQQPHVQIMIHHLWVVSENALPIIGGATSVCVEEIVNITPATGGTWTSNNGNATVSDVGIVTGVTAGISVFTFIENSNRM